MYTALLHTHSGLRYIVLLLLIAVLVKSLEGWLNRKPFSSLDDKLSLFFFISVHIQLTVGLALYFVSPMVRFGEGMMSDGLARYWSVEHITANLIAVVLFTLGRTRSKKMTLPEYKHRTLFLLTAAGAIVLFLSLTMSEYAPGLFGGRMAN